MIGSGVLSAESHKLDRYRNGIERGLKLVPVALSTYGRMGARAHRLFQDIGKAQDESGKADTIADIMFANADLP